MWIKNFIFPAFMIALATPMATAQTPTKATVSENATAPAVDPTLPKPQAPQVMSFLEWKSQRVHDAQVKLEQISKGNPAPQVFQEGKSTTDTVKPTEQKLNFNVDVALQLNIQDYFSMYLKNLTPEDFKEATKKLSPDEVAELLSAYKNSLDKPSKIQLKFTKSAKDNAKGKNTEL